MDMRTNGLQIAVFMDFENVATSAEANFGDFDINCVLDLLRTRGRLLIKRAYGDWGRFHRYRRPMMENGVDLFQLYSVGMQQKNRADVRLAIDALETVFTRPNIDLYAIISGDSDFTELIHKLRDYGKYTIGIGLRSATSDLLRRACDEFIFYETLVVEEVTDLADELHLPDPRDLLRRALVAAEQKGECPVFAGRLKQIMLGLDSSFNEANYGFAQFRAFLEAQRELISIQEDGLQLYVSLRQHEQAPAPTVALSAPPPTNKPAADLSQRYRSFLREANMRVVDQATRGQVLEGFIATLQAQPEPISLNAAVDLLKDRYDAQNALTPKIAVPDIIRLLVMSNALTFAGGQASSDAPVRKAEHLVLAELARACETVYLWRLVEGGVPVIAEQLAPVLYETTADTARVQELCHGLTQRHIIVPVGDGYTIAPEQISRLVQRDELVLVAADLARVALPPGEQISPMTAENLFREGSELRQKDFAGSAQRYLQAARVQLEALRAGQARAGFDDLKWYLASYCSVKAGHAFVSGTYEDAVPYYLAFFSLAQEGDSVWPRIQRLVSPMLSYYFAIAGKQLDETVPANLGRSLACQVALRIHSHSNARVGAQWEHLMERLAEVNLGIIRQLYSDLAAMGGVPIAQDGMDTPARIEHSRSYLKQIIERFEAGR
jgi:uncharacterized LabA/DUF88 family protein